jgi:hypothetical protein
MAVQLLNDGAGQDTFQDLYDKFDNNANEQVVSGAVNGNNIQFLKFGGGFFNVSIPNFPDQINSGLVLSPGLNIVNYTAGVYQINNRLYNAGAGSFVIPSAGAGLSRIDAVVAVDDLTPPTGTIALVSGTDAVSPVSPTLTSAQLLIGLVIVDDAGNVNNQPVQDCCVPDGTIEGQTLRWDNVNSEWDATNILILEQTNSSLVTNNSIAFQVNNGGSNNVSMQLLESDPSMLLSITDGTGSATLKVGTITGDFGLEVTSTDLIRFSANEGIQVVSFPSAPVTVTDKLYNVSGDLYWNGAQVCLAPCGGGGGEPIPAGTVNFSTIRWDDTAGDWVENTFTRMNDATWSTIMYGEPISPPTVGNVCILYASIFKGTAVFDINANASVALASGTDNVTPVFVNHSVPTLGNPYKGYNALLGTYRCNIVLDSQIGGAVIIASDQGVINKSTSDLGAGFSSLVAVKNCSISQSIDYNFISASQNSQVNYGSRCAIIGSTSCLFTSSATNVSNNCLIESSLSSEIRTYSSGVAVKQSERCHISSSQNSVIRGATNTEMTATQSSTIKSHGASTTTYSQLCNLVSMQSCFNCTIQQTSILHFSSMYAVNMLACDNCEIDTNDNNLNSFALVGCKNTTLTLSDNITSSAFIGCTGLAIAQTVPAESAVVLGYKASHGLTKLREYTTYVPSLEIKEGILITSENIISGSGTIPNFVHRIIVIVASTTQNLPSAPFDGETHKIISRFAGTLNFTTVNGNGKNINGNPTIQVPGDYGCVTLEFSAAMDEWYIVAKTY